MPGIDYIPKRYIDFSVFLTNLLTQILSHRSRLGISEEKLEVFQTAVNSYQEAHAIAETPVANKTDRLRRKNTAKTTKRATRTFVNENLRYNSLVTDEDRSNMGLTIADKIRTPVSVPNTMPRIVFKFPEQTVIRLSFRDSGSGKRGKPPGVYGVEISWEILNTPPVNREELIHSTFTALSTFNLRFLGQERGKIVYFSSRYINTRGEKGEWSGIQSVLIP